MNIWNTIVRAIVYRYTNKGLNSLEKKGCLNLSTGCFNNLAWIGGLTIIGSIVYNLLEPKQEAIRPNVSLWEKVKVGDSLFVQSSFQITFFKKGRTKLEKLDQLKLKKRDTLSFIPQKHLSQDCFVIIGSTYIGFCIAKDSTSTKTGNQWLVVEPASSLTNTIPKRPKPCIWQNKNSDKLSTVPLSSEFYVKLMEVQLNDNYK